MSSEDLFETEAPEDLIGGLEEVDRPDTVFVTSDRRGVSWLEQEMLAFGPVEGGSLGPAPPPPMPGDPGLEGEIRPPATAQAASWSFGGPPRPAHRPEQQPAWSFGGPERPGSRWAVTVPSRRF